MIRERIGDNNFERYIGTQLVYRKLFLWYALLACEEFSSFVNAGHLSTSRLRKLTLRRIEIDIGKDFKWTLHSVAFSASNVCFSLEICVVTLLQI